MVQHRSLLFGLFFYTSSVGLAQVQGTTTLNEPVDISPDFKSFENTYYFADNLESYNPETGDGMLVYKRYEYYTRIAFNNMTGNLKAADANEFPTVEYQASPAWKFKIDFSSPRTIHIKALSGPELGKEEPSLILVNGTAPSNHSAWVYAKTKEGYEYTSPYGRVVISEKPFQINIFDEKGKLLTSTINNQFLQQTNYTPALPFCYVRRAGDYSRSFDAVLSLSPDEKIFGCGETFTNFNKRGQKVILWTDDANGVSNESIYKPIPFYLSSRGYGVFMHTSTPITCDFGKYLNEVAQLMIGDETLDLFIFLGQPKEVLNEYTNLTGKAQMPPLWSFGLWMSRISYFSEKEGREVAAKLRDDKIPSDVLHFDTGWFQDDWRCDYTFSPKRFDDPKKMIDDLLKDGFHICLWQIPYFVPKNKLFNEIIDKGLYIKNSKGTLPTEDAVLDFSNPATVKWYQDKIGGLLKMGVGAIKVDFGEAAAANGVFYSGKTGFYEHNLYPLRYNKTVADITKEVKGENIMWARSAWAGSQRYPLHWGGDAASTNNGMEAELRGGLSFGVSGFSFWSHDIGGFVQRTPEDIYRRWLVFGMLSSHSRCHGMPPKEPWEYGKDFEDYFRKTVEIKYKLMPYVYAQAKACTEQGLPMVRALFVEYPEDPGAWLIDNQYLYGSDILVAPLFDNSGERDVYLPGGNWIDYQSGEKYNTGWHHIKCGEIEAIILVKEGACLPMVQVAQSTSQIDWNNMELVVFGSTDNTSAMVCLPSDNILKKIEVAKNNEGYVLVSNPLPESVKLTVTQFGKN
jgi:alpha-D-xyloside xylohydrolase